ncbi:MAG: cell division protein FtsZ, partial [Halobacteriaceae archaeon]
TGVQSAQVLGPTTQKQADKSRQSINDETAEAEEWNVTSDGGQEEVEQNNGLDVIR